MSAMVILLDTNVDDDYTDNSNERIRRITMFTWLKNLFQQADDVSQMAQDGAEKARQITDMIPGDADDKTVDAIADKVDEVTQQFDAIKKNLPK